MENSCLILPTIKKAVINTLKGKYRSYVEDLVHDIYLKVSNKLEMYDAEKGGVEGWVYRVSVNHVLDFFEKMKKSRFTELDDSRQFSQEGEEVDEMRFDFLLNKVFDLIETYSYEEKCIMLDRHLLNLRDKELSEKIGIPSNQIPMYRKRIRERLLKELNGYRLSA
jgi:RNA polymerase sigma factor (sigma-70 family)